MMLSILLCFCLLAQSLFPHMPTVYEFCSHVVANGESGQATCDTSQCQGRPGNIGPRGIQELKGQKGETQTSETVEEKVRILEESLKRLQAVMISIPIKETVCYMGMKSGPIPDSAITSSSDDTANHVAHLGRLDNQPSGTKWGTWTASSSQAGSWIQVDLGQPEVVACRCRNTSTTSARPMGHLVQGLMRERSKQHDNNNGTRTRQSLQRQHGQGHISLEQVSTAHDLQIHSHLPANLSCLHEHETRDH